MNTSDPSSTRTPEATAPQNVKKDFFDKLQSWGVFIASVAIPLVALYVSNAHRAAMQEGDSRLQYMNMAVAIISQERKPETAALLDWAVDMLAAQARDLVPLSEAAREELRTARVRLEPTAAPNYDWHFGYDVGGDYGYYDDTGSAPAADPEQRGNQAAGQKQGSE